MSIRLSTLRNLLIVSVALDLLLYFVGVPWQEAVIAHLWTDLSIFLFIIGALGWEVIAEIHRTWKPAGK